MCVCREMGRTAMPLPWGRIRWRLRRLLWYVGVYNIFPSLACSEWVLCKGGAASLLATISPRFYGSCFVFCPFANIYIYTYVGKRT